ncbi:MAG: OsmC family protein [Chloroflexi bacterium]|nr:OsmC family protein [Chloroflexota bacterium]
MAKKTASVRWVSGRAFETQTGSGHRGWIDAFPKEGETSKGPTPTELVLVAVAGCTGIDIVDILQKKRLNVTGLDVAVEGTQAANPPNVYTELDVVYRVRGKDIPASAVEQAIKLSEEKYCSVGIMIGKTAKINSRYEIVAE